jgi:hypothetical protein
MQGCNEISAEVATIVYLEPGAFRVESTSPGTFCITIYPGQCSEQSKGRQVRLFWIYSLKTIMVYLYLVLTCQITNLWRHV